MPGAKRGRTVVAMRPPVKSEADAFVQTMVGAAVILASVLLGVVTTPLAGVVLAVVAAIAAVVAYVVIGRRDRPAPLRAAMEAPHPAVVRPDARHVLVVANEPLAGIELIERMRGHDGEHVEVDVVAPVLTSRVHLGVSDIDREREQARRRLDRSMAWARQQGIAARGHIGDASPAIALEDELRAFGADEVIVVTHAREEQTWQEREELDRLRRELAIPVTEVTPG